MSKELQSRTKSLTFSVSRSPLTEGVIEKRLIARGSSLDKVNKALVRAGQQALTKEEFKARIIRFVASDATPDRYGDVVNPKGFDLTEFRNNPVFLAQHNSREAPIGISINEEITDKSENKDIPDELQGQLVMDIFFHGITEKSREMFSLYDAGMMKAVSVGFVPIEIRQFADDKEREKFGIGRFGELFERQKLLELSAVTIPANPNATAIENSLTEDSIIDKVLKKLPELFASKFATPNELSEVAKQISSLEEKINLVTERKGAREVIQKSSTDEVDDTQILDFLGSSCIFKDSH